MITCPVWVAVRVTVGAVVVSSLQRQLHDVGERTITNLVGGRNLHQVDVPWLQLLQQGHSVDS